MNHDITQLFPDDLSDAAACALCDVLHALAFACDSRYLIQIRRHRRQQEDHDPERPWIIRPPDQ